MRTLLLLSACAALLSGPAASGEIVILDSGTIPPPHGERARQSVVVQDPLTGTSVIVIERPSRDEALGRRDPGLEAKRATRRADAKRREKDHGPVILDEPLFDGTTFLETTIPFGLGRGDPGQEAARAALEARRMRLTR